MTELPHLASGHLALLAPAFLFLLLFSFLQHGRNREGKRHSFIKFSAQFQVTDSKRPRQRQILVKASTLSGEMGNSLCRFYCCCFKAESTPQACRVDCCCLHMGAFLGPLNPASL